MDEGVPLSPHPFQPDHEKTPNPSDATVTPRIWNTVWLKSLTNAALGAVTMAIATLGTPRRTGFYRISGWIIDDPGGFAGDQVTLQLGITDLTGPGFNVNVFTFVCTGAVQRAQGTIVFEAKAGAPINYAVINTNASGAPTVVDVRMILEEIA